MKKIKKRAGKKEWERDVRKRLLSGTVTNMETTTISLEFLSEYWRLLVFITRSLRKVEPDFKLYSTREDTKVKGKNVKALYHLLCCEGDFFNEKTGVYEEFRPIEIRELPNGKFKIKNWDVYGLLPDATVGSEEEASKFIESFANIWAKIKKTLS